MDLSWWIAFLLPSVLYGAATGLYFVWFRRATIASGRQATATLWAAVLVQVIGLLQLGTSRGFGPPTNLGETLSMAALSTAVIYLYLESRGRERGLGVFGTALMTAIMVVATVIGPGPEHVNARLRENLFAPHATALILALAGFTMSAFLSIAYLAQYRQLRDRRPGLLVQRLPSLQSMDAMLRRSTRLGWIFLTIGMILGALLWKKVFQVYWEWDPKQCTTLLTWLLYGAALLLRRWRQWQGERVAYANLFAFSTVLLGMGLLYTVLETAHKFGADPS